MGFIIDLGEDYMDETRKNSKNNIILIGMPSSGKSTVGKVLAKKLNVDFIDTDCLLRKSQGMDLRDIVINFGHEHFLKLQEEEILKLVTENSIIATGGSVVYSENAMKHLSSIGNIVYLQIDIDELTTRIKSGRRFAKRSEQSFEELYYERVPLYEKYSDCSINCTGKSVKIIADEIFDILCNS